jgi:hypothetical protein
MPDWTYIPLRRFAGRMLGTRRSQSVALSSLGHLAKLPGGYFLVSAFGFSVDYDETEVASDGITYRSPVGVVLESADEGRVTALLAMGFGFVCTPTTIPPGAVKIETTDLNDIQRALISSPLVAVNRAVIEHGPGTAQRINEAIASSSRRSLVPSLWFGVRFWKWPGWVWALWLGIAMVCAGIGAAIITLGPVLLNHDKTFLGTGLDGLQTINPRLVSFLKHDRITMAGCMMAIGFNDIGFAFGMRKGWRWAKVGFGLAGGCGFPTFFLLLGYRFVDPLHLAVAVGFFPLYLLALTRPSVPPCWTTRLLVNEPARRRALVGQLMLVSVAGGVAIAGLTIMFVGLHDVLIPPDRAFMGNSQSFFETQLNGRLLRFVAHDRAGFGGALFSLGVGILTTALWGWRESSRSTWISTMLASIAGFVPALAIHFGVGYTDTLHLLPAYVGVLMVGIALLLSREWLCD